MQFTEKDLSRAVDAGILSVESVERFRNMVTTTQQEEEISEGEHFRLVGGYSDVFVTIACLLLLVPLPFFLSGMEGYDAPVWVYIVTFLVSVAMAELFVRRRRFALTGIMLVGSMFIIFSQIIISLVLATESPHWQFLLSCTVFITLGWALWRRYGVPITVALAALGVVTCILIYVELVLQVGNIWWLMLLSGLLVFMAALYLDRQDMARHTITTDVAFWLHLLAAPLITHPVFTWLDVFEELPMQELLLVTAFFLCMVVLSILVDRRSLIVACLLYVLTAFGRFLHSHTPDVMYSITVPAMLVGVVLLLLSVYWNVCRRIMLGMCPASLNKHLRPAS